MGFQGDVAGIGLGELLQGLARGGREGVLTLHATGLGATLGLAGGQLHLLPEADENPEIWRKRCERAWSKDPNHRIDSLRMGEIAFAARMEGMFRLLDSEGVHFRFEPGPLPIPGQSEPAPEEQRQLARAETGTRLQVRVPVLCHPISVEYLLLEYARLTDECLSNGDATLLPEHLAPRLLVPEPPSSDLERFWSECDGVSSVIEIADRLGWPLRQVKATVVELAVKGYLRYADSREMLILAQREIADNRFMRAASRLTGWCLTSPPGPPASGDVELLLQEWDRGKLPVVLASMTSPAARTLLRRIELVDWDVKRSIQRWTELRKHHRRDVQAHVHLLQWQLRSEDEEDAPQIADLIKLAREFQECGWPLRAGVLLRAAAERMPESTAAKLEVGTRLIAVGHVEQGAGFVLDACRVLIEANHADKALGALRVLLEAEPTHREARQLLATARTRSVKGKQRRRNLLIVGATGALVALGAVVKVRIDDAYDQRLKSIAAQADNPVAALAQLELQFDGDDSDRVATLRHALIGRVEAGKQELRNEWMALFKAVQQECSAGDVLEGFRRSLALPAPPEIGESADSWPSPGELLESLAARLEQEYARLPALDLASLEVDSEPLTAPESALLETVTRLTTVAEEEERTYTLNAFLRRLGSLQARIEGRSKARTGRIEERRKEARLVQQDQLLRNARTHVQAGDIERAVEHYRALFSMEGTERIREVFGEEAQAAERHLAALMEAERLARAGDHAAAEATLRKVCPHPEEHVLPWKVASLPAGARVLLGDGSTRPTPIEMNSAIGEHVELTFELAGHETVEVVLERPTDVLAILPRLPDLWWRSSSRVSALPIVDAKGHVVTNRSGDLVLLDEQGEPVWESHLDSLGGVARTPAFLPDRPDALLVLTEEGDAWLVEVGTGRAEGPWSLGSPPIAGPTPTADGVLVTFADGSTALWTSRLRPQVRGPHDEPFSVEPQQQEAHGYHAGLSVLRRSAANGNTLTPPWGEWTVRIEPGYIVVDHAGEPERSFHVRRNAEWSFVAWEAPDARHPEGTVWVSDEDGLRAFHP